jgi:glycosyltransferase involved in cell wall biosynthesis
LNLFKPKKIVWVAHESNKSGANLCLLEFVEVVAKLGYDQLVVLPHTGNMEGELTDLGVRSKIIHYYAWVRPIDKRLSLGILLKRNARNLIAVINLILLFLRNKPDIVFTNTSVINIAAIAAVFTKSKHLWYVHEMGEEDFNFKLPWGKWSCVFMNLFSFQLLTNSSHLRNKYRKIYDKINIKILRYIVKTNTINRVSNFEYGDTLKLLILGQVAETKGHLVAIKALADLKSRGYFVELSIVGGANDSVFLEKLNLQIANLGIKDIVHYSGYSDDVSSIIARHHALLMCSKCEAFGRVTVEAMKIGIPVIGSNTCGTRELIIHEETGLLFDQGDSNSLMGAIINLIENDELRQRIVRRAKEDIELLVGEQSVINFFANEI